MDDITAWSSFEQDNEHLEKIELEKEFDEQFYKHLANQSGIEW